MCCYRECLSHTVPKQQRTSGQKLIDFSNVYPPKPNITKDGSKALKDHRQDKDRLKLISEKGMAMVVLDKQDYISKSIGLLTHREAYKPLTVDPTNTHKNKLINMLRTIKAEGRLGDITYKRLYPAGAGLQHAMGYPKSTKRTSL